MSGADVPYQLRPNKAVERFLWVEILDHVNKWKSLESYAYISMGGRYLEDFKLVHSRFNIRKLYSLEMDPTAHQRQVFNRPLSLVHCLQKTTGDFVIDFGAFAGELGDLGYVLWFDYTSPKERLNQLQELESMVSKLAANDVIKITMNAGIATMGQVNDFPNRAEFQRAAMQKLKDRIGDYYPEDGVDALDMELQPKVVDCWQLNKSGVPSVDRNQRFTMSHAGRKEYASWTVTH